MQYMQNISQSTEPVMLSRSTELPRIPHWQLWATGQSVKYFQYNQIFLILKYFQLSNKFLKFDIFFQHPWSPWRRLPDLC